MISLAAHSRLGKKKSKKVKVSGLLTAQLFMEMLILHNFFLLRLISYTMLYILLKVHGI